MQNRELSIPELKRVVPSLFAETPHESRSERYAYIPTVQVLHGLYDEGFRIFNASQTRTRQPGKAEFTKHMLRLRHASHLGQVATVGDSIPELILINSHDGSSSFQLMGGMFRFVCSNGMIVPDTQCQTVRVSHSGDVTERVKSGAFEVLDGLTRIVETRDAWRRVNLSEGEQLALAEASILVRYDLEEGETAPIQPRQLLQARRWDDHGNDLWRTFNRIQENAIKGGLSGRSANGARRATRAVSGIDQNVRINRALWQLAEAMKALKDFSR